MKRPKLGRCFCLRAADITSLQIFWWSIGDNLSRNTGLASLKVPSPVQTGLLRSILLLYSNICPIHRLNRTPLSRVMDNSNSPRSQRHQQRASKLGIAGAANIKFDGAMNREF